MLLLPRSVPPEIAAKLEEQLLCSSIEEALRNILTWLGEHSGAEAALLRFDRGFIGGKRSDRVELSWSSREGAEGELASDLLKRFDEAEVLDRMGADLREVLQTVTWNTREWPYGPVAVFRAEGEGGIEVPQPFMIAIPFSTDLIVAIASERPFFGFVLLLFDTRVQPEELIGGSLGALPELLSGVVANFIRERTSREEMLGFFALNVQNHLFLTQALLSHMTTDDPETRAKLIAKMERGLKRMMIETDLVLLADKDASENFKTEPETLSLNDLIREITSELQPVYETAKIRFRLHLDETIPPVRLDPKLFPSVLYNLFDNAFKFSRRFQSITVRTFPAEGGVRLEVSDNGIGIPEDQWKVVFLKHYRASNNEEEGHGLGLYIVKRIVEAHQGRVYVTKRPGVKTTVVVDLPVQTGADLRLSDSREESTA